VSTAELTTLQCSLIEASCLCKRPALSASCRLHPLLMKTIVNNMGDLNPRKRPLCDKRGNGSPWQYVSWKR
jgi:hypothetical protein